MSEGFVGKYEEPEVRRTAFWFLIAEPLLMGIGHIAVHAVTTGDHSILEIIGSYLLVSCAIGVAAFPRSPLCIPLLLSPIQIVHPRSPASTPAQTFRSKREPQ